LSQFTGAINLTAENAEDAESPLKFLCDLGVLSGEQRL
jgi:hypothetical protein